MAASVEDIVHALCMTESGDAKTLFILGDNGHALGPYQLHPDFFIQWYAPVVSSAESWMEAMHLAITRCVEHYLAQGRAADKVAMIFHLGAKAVLQDGQWDKNYASRFQMALNGIQS